MDQNERPAIPTDGDFLVGCFIKGHDGDDRPLFVSDSDGIHARLHDMAIVPKSEYEALIAASQIKEI